MSVCAAFLFAFGTVVAAVLASVLTTYVMVGRGARTWKDPVAGTIDVRVVRRPR